MSEMIERVARAICAAGNEDPDYRYESGKPAWKYCRDEARAAITAMRKPTEAMRAVSAVRCHKIHMGDGGGPVCAMYLGDSGLTSWERMIDAALT